MLQNEDEVGQGIKDSGVPREKIFITSKLWCTFHDRVEECLDKTLKSLGVSNSPTFLLSIVLSAHSCATGRA